MDGFARAISSEMGKPITQAYDEVEDAIKECQFLLNRAITVLGPSEGAMHNGVRRIQSRSALGVVGVIAPWNYPLELSVWGVVGALLAGNGVLYKPSEYTPLVGQLLVDAFHELGLPDGLLAIVHGDAEEGQFLVGADIDCVWFIGSSAAGADIYRRCSATLKKCVLEMGGSSPAIILGDMNIDKGLIDGLLKRRFTNTGQVCSAIKRLYVHENVHDELVDALSASLLSQRWGRPSDELSQIGPVANRRAFDQLVTFRADALSKGAISLGFKEQVDPHGYYFPPALLINADQNMQVMKEEVFGPLLPIQKFSHIEEAVEMANNTPYGLSAWVCGGDAKIAARVADGIDAGRVYVNNFEPSGIEHTFQAFKKSGLGMCQGDSLLTEFSVLRQQYLALACDGGGQ